MPSIGQKIIDTLNAEETKVTTASFDEAKQIGTWEVFKTKEMNPEEGDFQMTESLGLADIANLPSGNTICRLHSDGEVYFIRYHSFNVIEEKFINPSFPSRISIVTSNRGVIK